MREARGFTAIRELLGSKVEYRRLDAFDLDQLEETFDFILCFGILHRVNNPIGLLKVLRRRLSAAGTVLLETYGSADRTLEACLRLWVPGAKPPVPHPRTYNNQRLIDALRF